MSETSKRVLVAGARSGEACILAREVDALLASEGMN